MNSNGVIYLENFADSHVKKIIEDENINNAETTVTIGSKAGENFFGKLYKIKATGRKNGKRTELDLIYKMSPPCKHALMKNISLMYDKEIFTYNNILPKLKEIEDKEKIGSNEKMRYPKCFKCVEDGDIKSVIMEDVNACGFKMENRFKSLDWPHVKIVLTSLSRLHGLSYILKSIDPIAFDKLKDGAEELLFNGDMDKGGVFFHEQGFNNKYFFKSLSAIKNKEIHRRLSEWDANKRFDLLSRLSSSTVPSAAICHGDTWTNNYLFRYNEVGQPVELCLIDWQLTKCASPITDIYYMLSTSTDNDFRAKYLHQVFEFYHSSLANYLKKFSIDVEEFYPKKMFFEDKRNYGLYGLFWGFITLSIIFEENADTFMSKEKLNNGGDQDLEAASLSEVYVSRINDLAEESYRLGYF